MKNSPRPVRALDRTREGESESRQRERLRRSPLKRTGNPPEVLRAQIAFYEGPVGRALLEESVLEEIRRGWHVTKVAHDAGITKAEVREIARKAGLEVRERGVREITKGGKPRNKPKKEAS